MYVQINNAFYFTPLLFLQAIQIFQKYYIPIGLSKTTKII